MPDSPDPLAPLADPMSLNIGSFASNWPTSMDIGSFADNMSNANAPMISGLPSVGNNGGWGAGAGGGNGIFGSGMSGPQFASAAFGGLQTLGNLWGSLKAMSLAKKQFAFSKNFATANLANQTKAYNTTLADREGSRAVMEGLTPQQAQSYISSNSLSTPHL